MKRDKKFIIICVFLVFLFFAASCKSNGIPTGEKGERDSTCKILTTEPKGKKVEKNNDAAIDYSSANEGFVNVKYMGDGGKIKVQITHVGDVTYTYDLEDDAKYDTMPLTQGSGEYTVTVYKNITSNKYYQVLSVTIPVRIQNSTKVFLYPNQYVNFEASDWFVALSEGLAYSASNDLGVVEDVYNYVTGNIAYDYDLAKDPPSGYLPDLKTVCTTKKGICFDYASLMCALLRSQGIPSKLIIGYAGEEYHAWISVYTKETGWVDEMIQFDGKKWTRMDPTYSATYTGSKSSLEKYLLDSGNYNALYAY